MSVNGDAELWQQLCSFDNPAPVRVVSFDEDDLFRIPKVELSPREWMLLDVLLAQRDRVVTKDRIAESWSLDRSESAPGSIEVYIHRLRRKLESSGLAIRTVRGLGYLLEQDSA